jgi:CheY-like chemotaxis protein
MKSFGFDRIHAVLFGLSEDLATELTPPLSAICGNIVAIDGDRNVDFLAVMAPNTRIIFCGANTAVVSKLRAKHPSSPIVVVSRHAEVSDWLDSIEAGATDYCAAPFEACQVQWIVETSLHSAQAALAA